MGNNVNWIQILFIVLVFGGGAIQWALRKLAEQRAVRQAKLERERLELERLRTGRVDQPTAEAAPAKPDLDTIAARRQRQLEELRRRQQAARRPAPAGSGPQGRPRPPATPPVSTRASERPDSQDPRRTPAQEPGSGHRSTISAPRKIIKADFGPGRADGFAPGEHEPDKVSELAARFEKRSAAKASAPVVTLGGDVPRNSAEWRRAIIASEILAKPLSERPAGG